MNPYISSTKSPISNEHQIQIICLGINGANNQTKIQEKIQQFCKDYFSEKEYPSFFEVLKELKRIESRNYSEVKDLFLKCVAHHPTFYRELLKIQLLEFGNLDLLQEFEKKSHENFESLIELYEKMIKIGPLDIPKLLSAQFLDLGLIEALKEKLQEYNFSTFFEACQKIAHLHPKIALSLIKYVFLESLYSSFTSEEQIELYTMLHKISPPQSDEVFSKRMKDLIKIFSPQDLENFPKFLKKSTFICGLGPFSTKTFFNAVLYEKYFSFKKNFDQLLLFYQMILHFGDSSIEQVFIKQSEKLSFGLIFLGSLDQDTILAKIFLKRVKRLCKINPVLVDAFTSWLCTFGIEHLVFKKEERLSICEQLLLKGSSKTLKLLMQPSDPLEFQKDVFCSEEKELDFLIKQQTLNAQKAFFIISSRRNIKIENDPHKKKLLEQWLIHIEKWCLLDEIEIPMEQGKTTEQCVSLSQELRRLLPLILSYRDPRQRFKLVDAFFETKTLLFNPCEKTHGKSRYVEEFSRILLSSCVQNGLSQELAQNIFNSILKSGFLLKDTKQLNSLLDFLDRIARLSSTFQMMAAKALLRALSLEKKDFDGIRSLDSMLALFNEKEGKKALSDYCMGISPDIIFKTFFFKKFPINFLTHIQTRYENTFGKFRNPRALFLYEASLQKLQGTDLVLAKKSLQIYIEAVLTGNFPHIRFQKGHNFHLDYILKKRPDLQSLWTEKPALKTFEWIRKTSGKSEDNPSIYKEILEIGLSQDAEDLFFSGSELNKSCLGLTSTPYYSKSLGGILTGDVLMITVKIKGKPKIIARSFLRVLWCLKKQQAVLLIEEIYSNYKSDTIDNAIKQNAIDIVKKFKLTLLTSDVIFQQTTLYEGEVKFLGGLNAFIYSDAADNNVYDGRNPILFENLLEVLF